jgi:hypothetical protein
LLFGIALLIQTTPLLFGLLLLNPPLFLQRATLLVSLAAPIFPDPPLLLVIAFAEAALLFILTSLPLELALLSLDPTLLFCLPSLPVALASFFSSASLGLGPASLLFLYSSLLLVALVFLLTPSLLLFITPLFLGLPLRLVVLTALFHLTALLGSVLFLPLAGSVAVRIFLPPLLLRLTSLFFSAPSFFPARPLLIVVGLFGAAIAATTLRTRVCHDSKGAGGKSQTYSEASDVTGFHE